MFLEIIKGDIDRNSKKIALFDLDNTLIKYNSGNNYEYLYKEVKFKLKELHLNGYLIGITTNQNGITANYDLESFKEKINVLLNDLDVPIVFLSSFGDSPYRKPSIGMFCQFLLNINSTKNFVKNSVFLINNFSDKNILNGMKNVKLDFSNKKEIDIKNIVNNNFEDAFYVGDAAGRKGDFSSADIKFAYNCGLKFYLPEKFFLNKNVNTNISIFNLRNFEEKFEIDNYDIIFVYSTKKFGGKKHFVKKYFPNFKINSGLMKKETFYFNCNKIDIIKFAKLKNYKVGIFNLNYDEEVNKALKFLAKSTGEVSSGIKKISVSFLKKLDNVINVPFIFDDKNFSLLKKEISKLQL